MTDPSALPEREPARTVGPVHLTGTLDAPLSRWLWLVKWALAIPHYILLFFLYFAFFLFTLFAFFAVLFTGVYPRSLFDFNVGVLRWTWRVWFYSYGALGTDRYPPFSLQDVADYPARLEIDYPERLRQPMVLVKWLLSFPHLLVVGVLLGGGWGWASHRAGGAPGFVDLLVLFAGVALLFTTRYPASIFDLVVGLDRWVARVAAYYFLLTDEYPPFRLDMGGNDPDAATPTPGTTEAPTT